MKKFLSVLTVLTVILLLTCILCSCDRNISPSETEVSFSGAPGWQEISGKRCYFTEDGTMVTGWLELDGKRYYLGSDGAVQTGWVSVDGQLMCFGDDGSMVTGWAEKDGVRCYINSDGTLASGWIESRGLRYYVTENGILTGWQELDGKRYYFQENGAMLTGWAQLGEQLYHFAEDGTITTGWVEYGENRYYFLEDGTAATGPTEIDGKTYYFGPQGIHVLLVNPWNYLPEGYEPDLVYVDDSQQIDAICYDALMQMLSDCQAAGYAPLAASCYRTMGTQSYLYQRKVNYYLELGYGREDAETEAAKVVAIPGTSEHQLGLAVDICDAAYPYLDEAQANTATQQWLMEHCWEYGFILRYPVGSTDITGIIYEPWHYRYVGKEVAKDIYELGVTLEEYLGAA